MTHDQIKELVRRIVEADGSEQEIDEFIDKLEAMTGHPRVVEMIFYPDKEMSIEEITSELVSYTPLRLPVNPNESDKGQR